MQNFLDLFLINSSKCLIQGEGQELRASWTYPGDRGEGHQKFRLACLRALTGISWPANGIRHPLAGSMARNTGQIGKKTTHWCLISWLMFETCWNYSMVWQAWFLCILGLGSCFCRWPMADGRLVTPCKWHGSPAASAVFGLRAEDADEHRIQYSSSTFRATKGSSNISFQSLSRFEGIERRPWPRQNGRSRLVDCWSIRPNISKKYKGSSERTCIEWGVFIFCRLFAVLLQVAVVLRSQTGLDFDKSASERWLIWGLGAIHS